MGDSEIVLPAPVRLNGAEQLFVSGLAPACAVLFTHGFEVAKVRMQSQSRLNGQKTYKNTFDCIVKIARHEGTRGLYKGLSPAILREASKNSFRLGLFEPILSLIHAGDIHSAGMYKRFVAGALCGVAGAVSCNPFEIVKTRLQLQVDGKGGKVGGVAVSAQHGYTSISSALRSIWRDGGFRALYAGSVMSSLRSMLGSGANLMVYSAVKDGLVARGFREAVWMDIFSSLVSAFGAVALMNPVDVARTKYYGQKFKNGRGVQFRSGVEAFVATVRREGLPALYKGSFAHFLRLGPHYCFTFGFLGLFRRSLSDYKEERQLATSFHSIDRDENGVLDQAELTHVLRVALADELEAIRPFLSGQQVDERLRRSMDTLLRSARAEGASASDGNSAGDSGVVSFQEFHAVAGELQQQVRAWRIEVLFKYLDKDRNGRISVDELAAILPECVPRDAGLTDEAYEALVQENARALVKYADANKQGDIEFEEFVSVCDRMKDVQGDKVVLAWLAASREAVG